jgi:D-glycerate 3-kinase
MDRSATTRGYPGSLVESLLDRFLARKPRRGVARLVGVCGTQASGKSTLCAQLVAAARARGVRALTLALDDYYLTRGERRALARRAHPLLATRGVPGTHDAKRLGRTLDALRAGRVAGLRLPRFDKGKDTRVPPSRERRLRAAPELVLVEGWCVGVPPQTRSALARPVNALELGEDPSGDWRKWVDARLRREYVPVWRRFDALLLLAAPSFEIVRRWRGEPERELRRRRGATHAMSEAQLDRFVMHYERLTRHALQVVPRLADVVVRLDLRRRVVGVSARSGETERTSG